MNELEILKESILKWWEDVRYDVTQTEDDQYNVYDDEPEFVKLAKKE